MWVVATMLEDERRLEEQERLLQKLDVILRLENKLTSNK